MDRCDLCQDEAEWYLTPDYGPNLCQRHFEEMLEVVRLWVLRQQMRGLAKNGGTKEPRTRINMAVEQKEKSLDYQRKTDRRLLTSGN